MNKVEIGLEDGLFILFADGKKITESFDARYILNEHEKLRRAGKNKIITTIKVIMHDESKEIIDG